MADSNNSDNLYEQLLADIDDYAIVLLDVDGNIQQWNIGAEKITGHTKEEVIGKSFKILYPAAAQQNYPLDTALKNASETGKALIEGWQLRKDNSSIWAKTLLKPVYNQQQQLTGFGYLIHNLTDTKRADERLKHFNQELTYKVAARTELVNKTEHRFKSIVENSFDAIIMLDNDWQPIYISPAMGKLFVAPDPTKYSTWEEKTSNIHPDDLGTIQNFKNALLENPGMPLPVMFRTREPNGGFIWVEGIGTNLLQDENVQAIIANFRDVNQRKQAEEKMMRAMRLYAVISQINQTIVHAANEEDLFQKVCNIATDIGEFDMAWIGLIDEPNRILSMVSESGAVDEDRRQFKDLDYGTQGPTAAILKSGRNFVSNDLQYVTEPVKWREYIDRRNFRSCCILPIRKFDRIIGSFNLYSHLPDIFDTDMINLLEEVSNDISFALNNFEQEKQQQRAEENLLHSEQLLNKAQQIALLGSWEKDYTNNFVNWSEQMFLLMGIKPGSIIPTLEEYLKYVHPDDVADLKLILFGTGGKYVDFTSHHRVILGDGSVRYHYSEAKFELDLLGNPLHLFGINQDVTASVLAEDRLVQSESFMRSIIENSADGIVLVNTEGNVVYASPNSKTLIGFEPNEIIGPFRSDWIHPEHLAMVMDVYNKVANTPNSSQLVEYLSMKKDGTYIWVEGNYSNHFDNNSIQALVINYRDVSVRKQAEENLRRSEAEMRQLNTELEERVEERTQELTYANNELEAFSYTVSHDLRTPIRAIQIFATLMQSKLVEVDPSIKTYLENILKSTVEMNDLIKDLLTFSKLGRQSIVKTEVDMNAMVSEVVAHLTGLEGNENAEVTIVPLKAIEADATLIRSVWLNLISNAMKYCRKNGPCKVIIAYKLENDSIIYMVKDNGIGFDMRYYDKLFKPFSRLHSSSEYKGTGAGLAICERIITKHGGNIWAESTLKSGSTFFFSLPRN